MSAKMIDDKMMKQIREVHDEAERLLQDPAVAGAVLRVGSRRYTLRDIVVKYREFLDLREQAAAARAAWLACREEEVEVDLG